MAAGHRVVAGNPAAARPVAGFAADPVGSLEAGAARPGRGAVAAEAHRRAARFADAEALCDDLAARLGEDGRGAAMGAGGRRRVLPEHDLVLADARAVALAAAMAGGAAAGGDADEIAGRGDRVRGGLDGLRVDRPEQQKKGRESQAAKRPETDRQFAAAPQFVLHAALLFRPKKSTPTMGQRTYPCKPQRRLARP